MDKFDFDWAVDFLNIECGYIDVENDETYTKKEIIEVAKGHYRDKNPLIIGYVPPSILIECYDCGKPCKLLDNGDKVCLWCGSEFGGNNGN